MKSLLSILTLAFTLTAFSQTPVNLNIYHKLGSTDFAFNQASQNNMSNGNFKLTRMEYYMTKFTIIHDGGMMTTVPDNVVALVSADEQTSIALGSFNVTNIEGIKFHIGVHTPVNHNDPSLQANGSPLAFQNPSMHWGWTSGYRFIALEGKTGTSMNQTTELHGLGDINYLETTVTALGSLYNGEYFININADYNRALEDIDISSGIIVHGEDQQAATMIQNFKNYVFSSSNSLAKVNPLVEANINLYPVPSNGKFTIETPSNFEGNIVKIFSSNGQLISEVKIVEGTEKTEVDIDNNAGLFLLEFYKDENKLFSKTMIIK